MNLLALVCKRETLASIHDTYQLATMVSFHEQHTSKAPYDLCVVCITLYPYIHHAISYCLWVIDSDTSFYQRLQTEVVVVCFHAMLR